MPGDSSARNGRKTRSPSSEPGPLAMLHRFWNNIGNNHLAGDYAALILLVAFYTLLRTFGAPFHTMFRLDDRRIQYPHAEVERVNVVALFLYAGIIPLTLLVLWAVVVQPGVRKTQVTILGLVVTILLTTFLTDCIKDAVGRPRPDLLARCLPKPSTPTDQLVTVDVCAETRHHVLHDGWRSFPSGHSSFSFAGLGYLFLFFASQLHLFRPRAHLGVVLLCLTPLLGAALIAISRLEDYRHDVGDVVCGSLLGLSVSYLNWRRYYPSLYDENCHEPYAAAPRSGRSSPGGEYRRARDEEEGRAVERFDIGDD